VVSLCPDIDVFQTISDLNSSVDEETPLAGGNICTVKYILCVYSPNNSVDRFKQSLQYITPPSSSVVDVLDTCLPADFILLLLSSTVEVPPSSLNTLRSILAQGTPSIIPIVTNLNVNHTNPKTRTEVKKSLLSYLQQYIPTADRVFASDDRNEASTVMRMVCTGIPNGIRWREQRSYVLPEEWRWEEDGEYLVFSGTIRGKPLQIDRLIHLPNHGDFQIEKICSLPESGREKARGLMDVDSDLNSMEVNPTSTVLATPTEEQDSLSQLADADAEMADDSKSIVSHRSQSQKGVRIDDHYYFPDEEPELVKKKLPKGLTDYQAAWYVSDSNEEEPTGDSDSEDSEDSEDIEMDLEDDDDEPIAGPSNADVQSEMDDTASEMHIDLSPEEEARQHALFKEREEDAKFPDEVEYPPNIPARVRFARYRALKSFRSSPWDVDEPDDDRGPSEWSRLVRFGNWRGTCRRMEDESLVGGVKPGMRVQVYLRGCPKTVVHCPPRAVYSLLKHERKLTTLNFTITPITRDEDEEMPVVKSKDVLVVQYANRRYECRPIFSQPLSPSSENNIRKFERYLQPGRTSIASWIGNTVIGKDVPILYFKKNAQGIRSSLVD